jgi:hypothetical protein
MGDLDIGVLVFFCPAADQDYERIAIFPELDPVTGAEINSAFKDTGTDSFRVRKTPMLDPNQRSGNLGRCRGI